ncbi:LuxR C-terminal-related transcriptional regulator [Microbacterium sp. SLBN-146]|uniref:LuxR C-terminal-related transcriptional regulator n=1 Tax=Microbacterium sp. SLBN-146 TaxID=2768457 RepID=UPI001356FCD8|nr:LuxR C-terminal-related transcriptional regulator [Microbacterium sp. SLBN-146]
MELIRSGIDVEVTGPWAGGVSDLVNAVRRRLEAQGFSLVTVAARPGFASMNFAALRFSLPEVFQATSEPAVVVDRLSRMLSADEAAVVVLENADHLDPFSLQAVTESVRRSRARLLASLSSMSAQPPRLLLDRPLLRESLRPLSYLDVEDLLDARSKNPIDPMLVRRIYLDSGGNAQIATALFEVGVRSGAIHAPQGTWTLHASDLWDPSLAALVEQSLSHLGLQARACLRLAVLAPADSATLIEAHGAAAVEELVLEGLLHVDEGRPAFVSPPIVVSYLRSRSAAGARPESGTHDRMSDRGWRQRLGQQLDAASSEVLASARERFAGHPGAATATALVRALWSAGASYAEAEELIRSVPPSPDEPAAEFTLQLLHARWLAFGVGEVDRALELLTRAEEGGGPYAADASAHRVLVGAWARGIPDAAVAWAREVAAAPASDYLPVTRVSIANLLMQAGWPLSALEIVGDVIPDDPEAASVWVFTRVSALLAIDEYDAAVALAEHHVSVGVRKLDRKQLFAASYGLIQARMYMGQWEKARELAENIQIAGRPNLLLLHVQRMARGVQAVVAAEQGRVGTPDSGLVTAPSDALPYAVAQPGIQETIERIAAQRYDNIAMFLLPAARSADEAGSRYAASYLAAYALALDPSEATIAAISGFTTTSELTAFDNFLAYMRPLVERPAEVISGTVSMVARGTFSYLAIIGTVRRAKSMEGAKRDALMREAFAMSRRLSVVFPRKVADAPDTETEPLSPRERQIARLAGRLSNAQIAERLGISKRTVDHHVSNALKKTGVASRHELAARIGTG